MSIPAIRAFIAGNSGSGKTTRAWSMYLSKIPRVIIVDQTGEWEDKVDAATGTVSECIRAIADLAPSGRWVVSVALTADDFADLVRWLVPIPDLSTSPVRLVGGCGILVDEVDLIAAQGTAREETRNLYRRSRHVGLTIVSATQRPANVSREVSAQSTQMVAHYLSEPRDRDYMADVMRWTREQMTQWLAWTRMHPHGAVWKEMQTGRILWLPEGSGPPQVEGPPPAQLALWRGDRLVQNEG